MWHVGHRVPPKYPRRGPHRRAVPGQSPPENACARWREIDYTQMNSFSAVLCDLLNAPKLNFEFPHVQHTHFFTRNIPYSSPFLSTISIPGTSYSIPFCQALLYVMTITNSEGLGAFRFFFKQQNVSVQQQYNSTNILYLNILCIVVSVGKFMDDTVDIGSNPVSKHQIQPECGE